MKTLHTVTFILLVVGGLNWGLEVFNFGIGEFVSANIANLVYSLVGIAALVELFTHKDACKHCCQTEIPKGNI